LALKLRLSVIFFSFLLLLFRSNIYAEEIPESLKQTEKSALQGDADAQCDMGRFFLKKGKPKDYLEAEKWFRMSAKQEHARGMFSLGFVLSRRAETIDDEIEIAGLYRLAADKGDHRAQYELGLYIINGKAGFKIINVNEAVILFKQAAAQNHLLANAALVAMAHKKECDLETGKESLKKLEEWAKRGIAPAQYNLGRIYEHGYIVPQDYKKAMSWYQKAAPKGMNNAYIRMGLLHETGSGVTIDYEKAMQSYKIAADKGDFTANFQIAQLYEQGLGVEKNNKTAVSYYEKAALSGHLESMSRYGIMRAEGKGIKKNDAAAAEWLMQAAAWGDPDAQYYLGKMYQKGRIDKELEQEDKLKRGVKLIRGRYHDAQLHAGSRTAKQLFEKAAAQGHKNAIAELERNSTLTGWFMTGLGVLFLPFAMGLFIWPDVTEHNPWIIRYVSAPLIFLTGIVMLIEGLKAFGWI